MGVNSKDISDWGDENVERHIKQLHPVRNQQYLDDATEFNAKDKRGSHSDNRVGVERGGPSVTWMTFDPEYRRKDLKVPQGKSRTLYIQGYNMFYMSNIYLSAADTNMFSTTASVFDYFEQEYPEHRISTENPAFTGIQLQSWTVLNNHNISIDLPPLGLVGNVEIILQGPAGYYLASNHAYGENAAFVTVTYSDTFTGFTGTTASTATTATTGTFTTAFTSTTGV